MLKKGCLRVFAVMLAAGCFTAFPALMPPKAQAQGLGSLCPAGAAVFNRVGFGYAPPPSQLASQLIAAGPEERARILADIQGVFAEGNALRQAAQGFQFPFYGLPGAQAPALPAVPWAAPAQPAPWSFPAPAAFGAAPGCVPWPCP